MFELLSRNKITLTPRLAERYFNLNTFKGQRPLNTKWVSELANLIREGLFLVGDIGTTIYSNGMFEDVEYLINGQHQCQAVILANRQIDAIFSKYKCETKEDVALLYRQFDNQNIKSFRILVRMEAEGLGLDWPEKISQLMVSGISLKDGIVGWHRNRRISVLKDYIPQGTLIRDILTTAETNWFRANKHMLRSPVICAMLITYEKSQRDTKTFWSNVRDGEGLTKRMPSFQLRDFLKETSYAIGRGASNDGKNKAGSKEIISRCITAWNTFRENRAVTSIKYYPAKPIPRAK